MFCILAFLWAASLFAQNSGPQVVAVSIDGEISPITAEIIGHAIDQAKSENAAMLLIRINTPGGLMDATRQIIQELDASPVPVVTYVTPSGARGASAGFFVLEAGDIAAMATGTNTGASSPVLMVGQMDQVMRNKVENDAAAMLRSMMTRRGRNSEVGEQTIRQAKSFTEKEALDQKLIDLIAGNEQQLFQSLDGREITRWDGHKQVLHLAGVVVTEARETLRERVVSAIADPNIGFILLVLGVLGVYVEFTSPGLIFPGIAGAILALLGTVVAFHSSHQLDRRRAAGARASAVRIGGEVRIARHARHRRDRRDGAGRAAAGERTARNAHSSFHRAGRGASIRGHHNVLGFDGGQGAAQ